MWVRLDMDPNDKTTWKQERTHMPAHHRELVHTFAPKACNVPFNYDVID